MPFSLEEIAHYLQGSASENPGPRIFGVKPLEQASKTDITYVTDEKFLTKLKQSDAGAVLAPSGLDVALLPVVVSRNPEADFARLTALFYPYPSPSPGISDRAVVDSDAVIGAAVSIASGAVVGSKVVIGDNCVIGPNVVIGDDVHIGRDTRIFPNVTVYPRAVIGERVIIHSGVVIGSDGFGFARDIDASGFPVAIKKYHSGTVEIGDDVEIGALCAIDRALAGTTKINRGVKIDNLVQIAHNVAVGDSTVIASQVGIAGSSSIGKYCMVGGQAGVKDHVSVGNGVILATRVGIYRNVPDGSIMAGSVPAMPHKVFLRAQSLFKKLPEMLERIRTLESLVKRARKED